MNGYRIDWTRMVPGGHHERESSSVRGDDLGAVRDFLDGQDVLASEPIVVTEYTKSDGIGRIVPASEWDVMDEGI